MNHNKKTPKTNSKEEKNKPKEDNFLSNSKTIIGAVILALAIRVFLFEPFQIDGASMQPTLLHGDRVLVKKYPYGIFLPFAHEELINWGKPNVGDIVIIKSPFDEVDIVKRVIAVEGDTIETKNHILYRNGKEITQKELGPCIEKNQKEIDPTCHVVEENLEGKKYKTSYSTYAPLVNAEKITIPKGHIYVRGDHRDHSNDSSIPHLGPIPIKRLKGKVSFSYFSCFPGKGFSPCDFSQIRWDRAGKIIN